MNNDLAQALIFETQSAKLAAKERALLNSTDWGGKDCESFSSIVKNCIEKGSGATRWKSSVFKDCSFEEAIESAFIELGLSLDDDAWRAPEFYDGGNQFDIEY